MPRSQRTDLRSRADAILDAARDLLLHHGYRRVAVEDVARRAGVGKGTVYLHWRTRDQMFLAVAAREAAVMMDAVAAAVRGDPAEAGLDRYLRRLFLEAMDRPVLRAVFTQDAEILGRLTTERAPLQQAKALVSEAHLRLLAEHGLVRGDLTAAEAHYSLPTIAYGFFAMEPLLPEGSGPTLAEKADLLADAVRRVFGAIPAAGRVAVADAAAALFGRLATDFRVAAYGDAAGEAP